MKKFDLITFLMNPKKWWLPLLIIFTISIAGVMMIGIHTYTEAPPIPDFISSEQKVIYSKTDILKGQAVFQKYALMEYGSMFGDGADRGPDFTAEALHQTMLLMNNYYLSANKENDKNFTLIQQGITEQVKKEIKTNCYNASKNSVSLSYAQVYAANELLPYYLRFFSGTNGSSFHPAGYIKNTDEIRSLTAFFFWGAWVCGVERSGETYSYTHNWPYDPSAGNTPGSAVIFWSIIGSLGLILGLGIVLYYHGKMEKLNDNIIVNKNNSFMSRGAIKKFRPDQIQKATYKFFYTAILLFAVQVLAGILTVHDFVGFFNYFGFNISSVLPETVTRSWHVQLSLIWISACWIAASFFVMAMISPNQPKHQIKLINSIFWLTVFLVAGSFAGIFLGPQGFLAKNWYWYGHQGWEYVELGKVWQIMLFVANWQLFVVVMIK